VTEVSVRIVETYVYQFVRNSPIYLLLKRSPQSQYGGLWQGVAGKIKPGEQAWQAALREIKEEVGLIPTRLFIAEHVSHFYEVYGDRLNYIPVFGAEINSDELKLSNEHVDHQWLDFKTANEKLIWKGQKEGLKSVNDMLINQDERLKWSTIKI
jgi:dATP pyrophosphohydrolase